MYVNIFIIYETLFQKSRKILLITYQNKTKMPKKIGSTWFLPKNCQVTSTIYKLFKFNFR